MKCHEAAAADNVTGRRSGGPPRPEGISSPAAAFLRSLEPSVGFDRKFRFGLLTKILCCALCTMKQNEAKAKKMSGCRCLQMCCVLPMIERFTCFTLYCFFSWSIVKLAHKFPLFFLPERSLSIIFSIVVSPSVFFSAACLKLSLSCC